MLELRPKLPATSFMHLFLLSLRALLDSDCKALTQLDFCGSCAGSQDQGLDGSNHCILPGAFQGQIPNIEHEQFPVSWVLLMGWETLE